MSFTALAQFSEGLLYAFCLNERNIANALLDAVSNGKSRQLLLG